MGTLIFLVIVGVILWFVMPGLIKRYTRSTEPFDRARFDVLHRKFEYVEGDQVAADQRQEYDEYLKLKRIRASREGRGFRFASKFGGTLAKVAKVAGVIVVILAVLATSAIYVPQGFSGHLKRTYGTSMRPGQIIADAGQAGPQKEILPPGFKIRFFIRVLNQIEYLPDVTVNPGHVLTIVAMDGRDKPEQQLFADPWPDSLDKKRMLENAEFAFEHQLQKGPQVVAFGPATYRFNQYLYHYDTSRTTTRIMPGEIGVCKANYGPKFDHSLLSQVGSLYYQKFPEYLTEGDRPTREVAVSAGLVPKGWKPSESEKTFNYEQLDDPASKWYRYFPESFNLLTRAMVIEAKLVPTGHIGVWWDWLTEGEYAINPAALEVTTYSTKTQAYNFYGGYTVSEGSIVFNPNIQLEEGQADVATDAISSDGFQMGIDYRIMVRILPQQAPYDLVMWGGWPDIENKSITPDSRSAMRNNAQNVACLDYVRDRELQERTTFEQMWMQQLKKGTIIVDVNYGEIMIPPDLRETQTRKVLAEQNKLAWEAEKLEQEARIATEEQRAIADQQDSLVYAQIQRDKADFYRQTQDLRGQGDASYDRQLADGLAAKYGAMASVIGPDGVMTLESLDRLERMGIKNITPMVLYQGAGGGDDALTRNFGPLNSTILGQMLMRGKIPGFNPADFIPAVEPDTTADTTATPPDTTGASTQP